MKTVMKVSMVTLAMGAMALLCVAAGAGMAPGALAHWQWAGVAMAGVATIGGIAAVISTCLEC
jgi:hypothetical protein